MLPIQASSVPCERAFSSSKETDTNRRSRLGTDLMEVLQILKSLYRSDKLSFVDAWMASPQEEEGAEMEADSQDPSQE